MKAAAAAAAAAEPHWPAERDDWVNFFCRQRRKKGNFTLPDIYLSI